MPLTANQLTKLHARYPARRAAITGAANGLGKSLALALAAHGWTLFLNDQNAAELDQIADQCARVGGKPHSFAFDVSDFDAFQAAVEKFVVAHGGVDLAFACAGIGVGGSFLDTELAHLREVVDVNLMGTFYAGKLFLPVMRDAKKGHFVTIASAAAFHGLPHLSAYAATKAGVVQWSETLRSEMKPFGVDLTVKMTTFYTSSIAEHTRGSAEEREKARSLVAMAPWSSEDVADALLLTVQRRKFYMVAPNQARILWRFKRFFPEAYLSIMPTIFRKLEAKLLKAAAGRGLID
jgi:short-subunit dehydrogenase